jgi:hypothetical protein
MTKFRFCLLVFVLLTLVSLSFAQTRKKTRTSAAAKHSAHVMITPDEIKWGPAPPALPPGAEMAVLRGDPSKAGAPFTIRIKVPDATKCHHIGTRLMRTSLSSRAP